MGQLTIFRCEFCGKNRPDGRADMRYCSSACKQKAYRWRQRMARYRSQGMKNITDLAAYLNYEETRQDAIENLSDMLKHIRQQAALSNVKFKAV